jgi:phosphatidylglycerol:prolipoprotein diacylglycerol transferase
MTAPDPIAFTIFGVSIRWYGILIATAFLTAILISCRRAPKHGLRSDNVLDLAIWMIPMAIIGARTYYVIFSWDLYKDDWIQIFDIRAGGLAIHGGLIAGIITAYFVCRHEKVSLIEMGDLIFPTVALGQAIGRWGNFFNSEAHGRPTSLPWGIMVNGVKVQPTFLYESIWCLVLFFFLLWIDNRRKFRGQTMCLYGMLYSVERCFVEGLRTDSLMIGPFRQAQVISVTAFIVCLALYRIWKKKYAGINAAGQHSPSGRKRS